MIKSVHLKALVICTVLGAALFVAFKVWRSAPSVAGNPNSSIGLVSQMEQDGIPVFRASSLSGQEIDIEKLKGKVVVVNFWASWCAPCVEEFQSMLNMAKTLENEVVVVAVSEDSQMEDITEFVKTYDMTGINNFQVVWDQDRSIGRAYRAERLPETFVTGPDLKLKKKIVGAVPWDSEEALKYLRDLKAL